MTTDGRAWSRIARWLLSACGAWLVGLGVYFIALRPALLPEDPRFIGTTLTQLRQAAPGLESWLRIVFTVMGGYIAGCGALTLFLARAAMPRRLPGTAWALGIAGLTTVVLMSAMNFVLHSDFRWVLVAPAVAWLIGVAAYVASD
jgi:hypothetical protein